MASKSKGLLTVIVVIIAITAAIGVVYYLVAGKKPTSPAEGQPSTGGATPGGSESLLPLDVNYDDVYEVVDDLFDDLYMESTEEVFIDLFNNVFNETIKVGGGTADNEFLNIDTKEVDNFGQLYDENEF